MEKIVKKYALALIITVFTFTCIANAEDEAKSSDMNLVEKVVETLSDSVDQKPEETVEEEKYTIAVITMAGICIDRPDVEIMSLAGSKSSFDILTMAERFRKAKDDEKIDAVLLDFKGLGMNLGQITYFRKLIKEIQDADKPVYAYSEYLSQSQYLLASACDQVIITHSGELELYGLAGEALYFKGAMDKIGLGADMISVGRYKSAAEQLTRTGPSKAEMEQTGELMDSLFNIMSGMISESRNMPVEKVTELIDRGPFSPREAIQEDLIDKVMYRDEFIAELSETNGRVSLKLNYGAAPVYASYGGGDIFSIMQEILKPAPTYEEKGDCIAVVCIDGVIASGGGDSYDGTATGSETIRNIMKYCRNNEHIKGIVVRIDSPGGSAMASDIIYHSIKRTAKVKPLVVSMGSVAASGGYYTACGSETIFADESTITGSIGVVGGKVYYGDLLDKVGISHHSWHRGQNSRMLSSLKAFSPLEKQKITNQMLETYSIFKERILATRAGKISSDLENLAQGRVYTGQQALKLGLIDKIGSFEDAISYIAKEIKTEDYDLIWLPRPMTLMETLDSLLAVAEPAQNDQAKSKIQNNKIIDLIQNNLGPYGKEIANIYKMISIMDSEKVLTVMPYQLILQY